MAFQGFTMSPPYGGLDTVSPIDNMDPAFALELVNVFPGAGAPTVRLGYQQFNTSGTTIPASPINFMRELPLKTGVKHLIAATDTNLYKILSDGSVATVTNATPHTDGRFNSEIFANNLYLLNGVDTPQVYTGTGNASNVTFTCSAGLSNLITCATWKRRLYFIQKNTTSVWAHASVDTPGTSGSPKLDEIVDITYSLKKGGHLLFAGSYTNQIASTSQDLFFACSSEGEVLFYSGTGPLDWSLVAHFYIAKPVGYRAFIRFDADIWIITQDGIVAVSSLFQADSNVVINLISGKVNPIISSAAETFPFSHDWSGFVWPRGRRVYVSIPQSSTENYFLVYSMDTKGWTTFRLNDGAHANSSCYAFEQPFYGSLTGIVYVGEIGQADAVTSTSSGQAILFSGRTAFSFYGSRGNYKAFKDIRPLLKVKRGVTLSLGLDTDFKRGAVTTNVTVPAGSFTAWGSPWGSPWSADVTYTYDRYAVKGQGHCAAVRFGGAIKNTTLDLYGFEIRYDMGGQV
jgi:hypothetical protein